MKPPAAADFLTLDAPAAHSVDLFEQQMERMFSVGLSVSPAQHEPFQTRMKAYCGRRLRFAALRFSPHTTQSVHTGQRPSRLLVTLQKEGQALVRQDGREHRIDAGQLFMIDPSRPFAIETGAILTHSIYVEPASLLNTLPGLEHYTARPIAADSGPGALFRAFVDGLFALGDTLQETTADRIADALPHLLATALTALPPPPADTSPTRLRALHRQRVLRFVHDNLRNPALDARLIAGAVQLSTRYLYELFEGDAEPLMKSVWTQRLERCRADLCNPALAGRAIGEMAYQWGFTDPAHFSRVFRQRFGCSPREARAAMRVAAKR